MDQGRLEKAIAAARAPLPPGLTVDQLLDAWRVVMGGINELGGWRARRGLNDTDNPRVFDTYEGNLLRRRVRKIEERIIVARRGDRPRGPCPVCKEPYEYELLRLYRNEGNGCSGCAQPCPNCGLVHRQLRDAWYLCVQALAKRVRELEAR